MADTIKCPRCAANVYFDAASQMVTCGFCGKEFTPAEILHEVDDDKIFENVEQEETEAPSEPKFKRNAVEWEKKQFVCNSCGATMVTDANTSTTYCVFCGSPAIIGERFVGKFEPEFMIPFKIDRTKATSLFFKWCNGGLMTPLNFVSPKNVARMKGLYVPFWIFGVKGDIDIRGTGKTVDTRSGAYEDTRTVYLYDVTRRMSVSWKGMPFDGVSRIDNDLMDAILPYNYDEMVEFSPIYLPGFFSEKYDVESDKLEKRALNQARKYATQIFLDTTKEYDESSISNDLSEFKTDDCFYALLPVWFLSYKYLGKTYEFAINGQTGEVAGEMPQSVVKKVLISSGVMAAVAIAVKIVVSLILGGFFG
ncbi:MAG: hypothetical protein GXZ12_07400 [Clostridiaceae bacterium]|jgi:ribosomal protein L37AE/L43A|nr:hypothetical protein [Clostridiaceae bacterium]